MKTGWKIFLAVYLLIALLVFIVFGTLFIPGPPALILRILVSLFWPIAILLFIITYFS